VLADGTPFAWRAADPDDSKFIWEWWTAPYALYWSVERRLSKLAAEPYDAQCVRRYLESVLAAPEEERPVDPVIGLLDGNPFSYGEFYWKRHTALASCPLLGDQTRGMHMVVGRTETHPKWLVMQLGADLIDWQFSEYPECQWLMTEPDVRNVPMRVLCTKLGLRQIDIIELPGKTARLMAVSRGEWESARTRGEA